MSTAEDSSVQLQLYGCEGEGDAGGLKSGYCKHKDQEKQNSLIRIWMKSIIYFALSWYLLVDEDIA